MVHYQETLNLEEVQLPEGVGLCELQRSYTSSNEDLFAGLAAQICVQVEMERHVCWASLNDRIIIKRA